MVYGHMKYLSSKISGLNLLELLYASQVAPPLLIYIVFACDLLFHRVSGSIIQKW